MHVTFLWILESSNQEYFDTAPKNSVQNITTAAWSDTVLPTNHSSSLQSTDSVNAAILSLIKTTP